MKMLTTEDIRKRYGVGRTAVHYWIVDKLFPNAQKFGEGKGLWLIPESDLAIFEDTKRGKRAKERAESGKQNS